MKFAILFRKKDLKGAKIPKFSIFENYNFYFLSNFDVFFVVVEWIMFSVVCRLITSINAN
jgi:hypothetical protein